jgi:hypothetical protein
LNIERKSLPGGCLPQGWTVSSRRNLRFSLKNINHQEEPTMDTNNKRRTASVTRVILCSTSILLWTFVSRPAMAQFTVTNSINNDTLLVVTPGGNTGGARMHGYIIANGVALSGNNDDRGAIWFATPGDMNLALYNNHSNIDETEAWDGTRWNVLEGLDIRVGSGGNKTPALSVRAAYDGEGVWSNVGIGTTNPQGALDVSSTKGGFIVPRMTEGERDALTAINGMIIYNTDTNQFNFREADQWVTKANNTP